MKKNTSFFKKLLVPTGVIIFTVLFQIVAANSPDFTEAVYSDFLYPPITKIMTTLFGWIPFSVSEIVILLLVVAATILVFALIFRKVKFFSTLAKLYFIAAIIYAWFYFSWGFNYFRKPLPARIGITATIADSTQLRNTLEWCISETNTEWFALDSINKSNVEQEIELCYLATAEALGIELPDGLRTPKRMMMKSVLNKTMTSGVFSPFFHEVHVNLDLLPIEYPFVLAHEKAHQMGIANEAEANFLAFITCAKSHLPEIRYSAHFALLGRLIGRARPMLSDYDSLRAQIKPEVIEDFNEVREKWLAHAGVVADVSHTAYDRYLKANKISEGVANYSADIDLLIQWRRREQREE